jgi:hypothetical protein
MVKILDKHEKERISASSPEAPFIADFAVHVAALRGSILIGDRLALITGVVEQIQTQGPLVIDDYLRLDGATDRP